MNPYEISNMQVAFDRVSSEFGLPSTSLSPNSAYIEVQLQDEDDEELLADDLSINTFDYPPHRDIVLEGDYSDWNPYNVCDTCVTPKYVTVDLNHSLPSGLVLDTLDMVYFPDEDPSWSSLLSESTIEDFYYRMEEEAYNLAGVHFGEQSSGKTSLLNRWTPNGNIKYCPKCSIRTERISGCAKMKCVRCEISWCWNCRAECSYNHFKRDKSFEIFLNSCW